MKFHCDKDVLLSAVNNVSKATAPSSSMEILKGIKLCAYDNLRLMSTNLELSIACDMDAEISEHGETVLDARILFDILRKSEAGVIHFEVNEKDEAYIYTKNNKFHIMGMPASEYPEINRIDGEHEISMPSVEFKQIVRDTVFAVAADESRPILTGVKFEIDNDSAKLVAIDGFRLAIRRHAIKGCGEQFDFILKGRILNEVMKVLNDDETPVVIKLSGNNAMFEFDNFCMITPVMGGEYISYSHFIPANNPIRVKVDRRMFTQTVERAAIIINYDDTRLPVILKVEGGALHVDCYSKMGNFHEELAVFHEGGNLEIGLGIKFLLDTIKAVEDDELVMEFNDEKSPCVVIPSEGDQYLYLVLPRQIKR